MKNLDVLTAITDSSQLRYTPTRYWAAPMDLSTTTEELPVPAGPVRAAPLGSTREQCAACGATLASDQRYCVECGQRLGSARLPFMDDPARHVAGSPVQPPAKTRLSVNSTLIAGVGTLLLAMGIGILIGRSSPASTKGSGPVQFVTAPGAGAASTGAATEALQATATESSSSGGSSGSSKSAKASSKVTRPKLPPPKVVTVGSPGKGKGYEKGHFTGNFFGKGEE